MRPAPFISYNMDLSFCIACRMLPHSQWLPMVRLGCIAVAHGSVTLNCLQAPAPQPMATDGKARDTHTHTLHAIVVEECRPFRIWRP